MAMIVSVRRRPLLWGLLLLGAAGCQEAKSATPLSPEIAGPIAGVTITAPGVVSPGNNAQVQDRDQPLTVVMANAETNGVRPLTMRLQVASDAGFATVVFSREALPPDPSGLTRFTLPNKLQSGRTYYWRAQGDDGANVSPWSTVAKFDVLQPIVLGTPEPQSPIGGAQVSSLTPTLTAKNGVSSGPVSALKYQFQVASTSAFAPAFADTLVPEGAATTQYVTPALPALNTVFFWRVRIFDATAPGAWSRVESFRSPAATPPPSGGGGGGVTGDWQSCAALVNDKPALSQCVNDAIQPGSSGARAFEVTKRIAWLLRGEKAGLLIKNGGENIIQWQGYSFSISRICYPDGHIYKVISDAGDGGTNGATWSDNGFVDASLYVPAIDPSKPEPEPLTAVAEGLHVLFRAPPGIETRAAEPARHARRPAPRP